MKKRIIPQTGMEVSPLTLGTMTFGKPVEFAQAVQLVHYAIQQGINVIDTANMYEGYNRSAGSAGGVAEEILGEALAGRRSQVILATKLGMKVGTAPEDEGTHAAAIRKQLQASLQRLKTDYIDIYYLHKPGLPEDLEGTLRELERARTEKAILCYGVSNYAAEDLQLLLATAKALGLRPPAICQPPLSLLKQQALQHLLPLCARQSIAVTPYQIYQGGLLTGKYKRGMPLPPNSRGSEKPEWLGSMDDALFTQLEGWEAQAQAQGIGMAAYALRWALQQPAVASAIVGITSPAQLDAALAALP